MNLKRSTAFLPRFAPDEGGGEGGGDPAPSWFDALPEDVRGNEAFAGWKDKTPADVLKSHAELEGKLSGAVIPPGENATPEEKQAYEIKVRQLLGVPEKAEDYKLTLPEGIPADDPVVAAMVKTAHAAGVNPAQISAVVSEGAKAILEHQEGQKLVNKEAMQTLWKADFDANLATTIKGIEGAGKDAGLTPEEISQVSQMVAAYPPQLVRMLHVVGRHYSEDTFKGGGSPGRQKSVGELFGWNKPQ